LDGIAHKDVKDLCMKVDIDWVKIIRLLYSFEECWVVIVMVFDICLFYFWSKGFFYIMSWFSAHTDYTNANSWLVQCLLILYNLFEIIIRVMLWGNCNWFLGVYYYISFIF